LRKRAREKRVRINPVKIAMKHVTTCKKKRGKKKKRVRIKSIQFAMKRVPTCRWVSTKKKRG